MNYPWLDEYCLSKPGSSLEHKAEWRADVFWVGGKIFGIRFADKEGRPILNLKIEPSYAALLRQDHADILPGYHMNKLHWISLLLNGAVPDKLVRELVDESYDLIVESLPRAVKKVVKSL